MLWIVLAAAAVVGVLALGWWTSGKQSSALKGVVGTDNLLNTGNVRYERFLHMPPGSGPEEKPL